MAVTSDSFDSPEPLNNRAQSESIKNPVPVVPSSRRERRELESRAPSVAKASIERRPIARVATLAPVTAKPRIKAKRPTKRGVASTVVMSFAAALVATMALPAYAFSANGMFNPNTSAAALTAGQQTLRVAGSSTLVVSRDDYHAPTTEELNAARREEAAAAAALRFVAVSQPVNRTFTVNPPSGPYSGQAIVDFAMQFVDRIKYSSGSRPEEGFGCDGLTQYVFGQFGIYLPRTVSNQAAAGVRIDPADAQPGDLMIYPVGHVAIYAGNDNGRIMEIDSPDWGRMVTYRETWTSNYYFVRVGI